MSGAKDGNLVLRITLRLTGITIFADDKKLVGEPVLSPNQGCLF